jgi:hypothetical protein
MLHLHEEHLEHLVQLVHFRSPEGYLI